MLLVASIVGIIVYAWLLFTYAILVLQVTAFIAVAALLVIAAWIGWTMATTPPPVQLEPEATSPTMSLDNPEEK